MVIWETNFFVKTKNYLKEVKFPFSSLLTYQRAKGKIIILSAFTSSSEDLSVAWDREGRNYQKTKDDLVFSFLFCITSN